MNEKDFILQALVEIKELRNVLRENNIETHVPSRVDTNPAGPAYKQFALTSAASWNEVAPALTKQDYTPPRFRKRSVTLATGDGETQRRSLAVARALLTMKNLGETYQSLSGTKHPDPGTSQDYENLLLFGQKFQMLKVSYLLLRSDILYLCYEMTFFRRRIEEALVAAFATKRHSAAIQEDRTNKLKQFLESNPTR